MIALLDAGKSFALAGKLRHHLYFCILPGHW
jgi:hypothetical protein